MKLFKSSGSEEPSRDDAPEQGKRTKGGADTPGRTGSGSRPRATDPSRTEMIPVDDVEYPLDVPDHDGPAPESRPGGSRARGTEDAAPDAPTTAIPAAAAPTTAIPVSGSTSATATGRTTAADPGTDPDADTRTRAFAPVGRTAEPTGARSVVDPDEPLPYGEAEQSASPVTKRGAGPGDRRGTLDLGLALLRVVLAVMLGLRGMQKLFGLFGSGGADAYAQVLGDAGFQHADLLAMVGGVVELAAALALLFGLATPVAASTLLGGVGLGLAVRLTHSESVQLLDDDAAGLEPTILYLGALLAVLFTGPGRWSADRRWRWSHSPRFSGFLWLVVAAVVGVLVWYLLNGTNPLTSTADSVPQPAR